MKRLADFRKQVIEGWTVQRIAAVLIVIGLVVGLAGFANKYCTDWCVLMPSAPLLLSDFLGDFYANIAVDCLSVAFAILVIDRLNERRAEEQEKAKEQQVKAETEAQLKAQLIREMGSPDNGIALRAVAELSAREWFLDDVMKGAYLPLANLQGAMLSAFNLEGATLSYANLQGANLINANLKDAFLLNANIASATFVLANLQGATGLTEQQLVTAFSLIQTVMPDGSMYDGRYNLSGDDVYTEAVELANNFRVTLEEYLAGQEWAREHLADLRREAGLDPDTGQRLNPTNGVEPQPANASASPSPRRNERKASMVSHRVRR